MLASMSSFAQGRGDSHRQREGREQMTPEQAATLQTKKMALALDLSDKQQQQIFEINLANAEFRKAKREERKANKASDDYERPTQEQRFEKENEMLDRRIAHQQELKKILTEDQYAQWKKMQLKKHAQKRQHKRKGKRG